MVRFVAREVNTMRSPLLLIDAEKLSSLPLVNLDISPKTFVVVSQINICLLPQIVESLRWLASEERLLVHYTLY